MIQLERTGTWHAFGNTSVDAGYPTDFGFSELHNLACLKSLPARQLQFTNHFMRHLPEAAAGYLDESDLGFLHLEVGALKQATLDAIKRRDWQTVSRHFAYVDDLFEVAAAELRDALCVSYLGNLLYGEIAINFAKARTLLPRSLAIALEKIERHYEELAS